MMNVAEIGQLHGRYVRVSDRFKSFWTFNQFAAGVYKNLLQLPLPYRIDFQAIYDGIRRAGEGIQTTVATDSIPAIERAERDVQMLVSPLVAADERIRASDLRRFLEKIRQQDEKIIFNLIKFYLYANAVTGDQRDKLDFLFTRIGEEFVEEKGEYWSKDSLELRRNFQSLVALRPVKFADQKEIVVLIRTIRHMKEEVVSAQNFEKLAANNLLENLRVLKHRIGDQYFHPDVLLAIVDANVTTKNIFLKLYRDEENRLIDDARRIETDAAESAVRDPNLAAEVGRYRRYKQEFDDSRARSNVKATVLSQLRQSINAILAQLDSGLDSPASPHSGPVAQLLDSHQTDRVLSRFGHDPLLFEPLSRMLRTLEKMDAHLGADHIARAPEMAPFRLEAYEAAAYFKLFAREPMLEDETEELLLLLLRAAALRLRIEEQAKRLNDSDAPEESLLSAIRDTLDRAKEYDQLFGDFLHDGIYYSDADILHRLYRSRFRLLRSFTGLWLIYDQRRTSR